MPPVARGAADAKGDGTDSAADDINIRSLAKLSISAIDNIATREEDLADGPLLLGLGSSFEQDTREGQFRIDPVVDIESSTQNAIQVSDAVEHDGNAVLALRSYPRLYAESQSQSESTVGRSFKTPSDPPLSTRHQQGHGDEVILLGIQDASPDTAAPLPPLLETQLEVLRDYSTDTETTVTPRPAYPWSLNFHWRDGTLWTRWRGSSFWDEWIEDSLWKEKKDGHRWISEEPLGDGRMSTFPRRVVTSSLRGRCTSIRTLSTIHSYTSAGSPAPITGDLQSQMLKARDDAEILNDAVERIVDELKYCYWREYGSGRPQPRTTGNSGSFTGQGDANRCRKAHSTNPPSSWKHRRRNGNATNSGRDDDEDGDDDGDQALNGLPRSKVKEGNYHFACPFSKRDPLTYHQCSARSMDTIAHVKQHLKRNHNPIHCKKCNISFVSEAGLENHKLAHKQGPAAIRDCSIFNTIPQHFMTDHQFLLINKRPQRGMTRKEQWYHIFRILFSGQDFPPSPFLGDHILEVLKHLEGFLCERGLEMMDLRYQQLRTEWPCLPPKSDKTFDCIISLFNADRLRELLHIRACNYGSAVNPWAPDRVDLSAPRLNSVPESTFKQNQQAHDIYSDRTISDSSETNQLVCMFNSRSDITTTENVPIYGHGGIGQQRSLDTATYPDWCPPTKSTQPDPDVFHSAMPYNPFPTFPADQFTQHQLYSDSGSAFEYGYAINADGPSSSQHWDNEFFQAQFDVPTRGAVEHVDISNLTRNGQRHSTNHDPELSSLMFGAAAGQDLGFGWTIDDRVAYEELDSNTAGPQTELIIPL